MAAGVERDELSRANLDLFRAAQPAEAALWRAICTGREMPEAEYMAAHAAVAAFYKAANVKPWQFSALSPRADGDCSTMRDALFSMATPEEVKQWREWEREHYRLEARSTAREAAARRADRGRHRGRQSEEDLSEFGGCTG